MESSGSNQASSDFSLKTSSAPEEYSAPEVITTYHLRDREMLRKRKAEAQERDSVQWIMSKQERKQKSRVQPKKACRGKKSCRGKGKRSSQVVVKPRMEPTQEPDLQSNPQVEAEPAAPVLAPPEPVPVLTIQDLMAEMESGAVEGMLAARSQDLVGEEELLEAAEAEIPAGVNIPLENDY